MSAAVAKIGIDMNDVGRTLEDQGLAAFQESFTHVLGALAPKRMQWTLRHVTPA